MGRGCASWYFFNGRAGRQALTVLTNIWAAQDEQAQRIGRVSQLSLPNLHLLRTVLLGRRLRDGNRQHAIFEMCVDCIAFGVRGKAERTAERPVLLRPRVFETLVKLMQRLELCPLRREFPVLSRENTASAALQPTLGNSLTGSGTLATASSLFWIRLLIGPTPCRRSRCQSLRIAA